ncbi:MAG: hypothetical protein M1834_006383 [Cirrosporium novae-zelandiae]|nr:MAG: hypothetical protein M1834_006383 [Cirrosporium novae-zelandiae]
MVLELHVWGPAFDLPSIDPQCLAIITYFTKAVPPSQWTLIATNDPTISPMRNLPLLIDGPNSIAGFTSIIRYLSKTSQGTWDLDTHLPLLETADTTAFSTFITTNGSQLLDLSLHLTSDNYTNVTRPIYTNLFRFPASWTLIPHLHAAAKARTAHLGLSSLDLTSAEVPQTQSPHQQRELQELPSSSLLGNNTLLANSKSKLSYLLAEHHHTARFRLDALVSDFLSPLQDLLSSPEQHFLLSSSSSPEQQPTSLDCLAFGYLALAFYPTLPSPWLRRTIESKYPCIVAYIQRTRALFSPESMRPIEELPPRHEKKSQIPWARPSSAGFFSLTSQLVLSTPIINRILSHTINNDTASASISPFHRLHPLTTFVLSLICGGSTVTGLLLLNAMTEPGNGFHVFGIGRRMGGDLSEMGEAGAMLASLVPPSLPPVPLVGTRTEDLGLH